MRGSFFLSVHAIASLFAGFVYISPVLAGVAGGAAGRAWVTDSNRLYIPTAMGMAGVAALLWRLGGAAVVPSMYAIGFGAWIASRPFVRPIPTGDGDSFSPTSETGLAWVLPGALLAAIGIGVMWHLGWNGFREQKASSELRILPIIGFACGLAVGWVFGDDLADVSHVR